MLKARQVLGERGERVAERWLEAYGWKIVARRFRSGHRDIDLVVELAGAGNGEGRLVAFVEVKTRVSTAYGGPLGAVDWRKQREMARLLATGSAGFTGRRRFTGSMLWA